MNSDSSPRKALFLDRDGVINFDFNYVYIVGENDFLPGIFDLAKEAVKKGYVLFVVTNQAGIGRGLYTEDDFFKVTKYIEGKFKDNGTNITKTYYCPNHPEHGIGKYKIDCDDRKPKPGMILKAAKEFNIDLANSLIIGDRESDIEAGINAGLKTKILFQPKTPEIVTKADVIIDNLMEATKYL